MKTHDSVFCIYSPVVYWVLERGGPRTNGKARSHQFRFAECQSRIILSISFELFHQNWAEQMDLKYIYIFSIFLFKYKQL